MIKVYPPLELKVFVDDLKLHFVENESRRIEAVPKVIEKPESKIRTAKVELSLTEEGKEGKSKLAASNVYFESKLLKLCDDKGIGITETKR